MDRNSAGALLAWRIAFIASLLACGFAIVVAFAVFLVAFADAGRGPSGPSATAASGRALTYSGPLPAGLDGLSLEAANPGETPDLAFDANPPANQGVALRTFVPVVSFNAGVYAVSRSQLDDLVSGRIAFVALGGYGGIPAFAVVSNDAPLVARLLPGSMPARTFDSYEELRAAFADPVSGPFVALVPLIEISPATPALSLDGIDPLLAPDLSAWPFAERILVTGSSEAARNAAADIANRLKEPRPVATRIVAAGDILLSRCTLARIEETGDWAAPFRGAVGGFLASADLTLGSLDGSIQDIGEPLRCVPTTNLTSPPEVIEGLTVAGFDVLTLATNHIADCGLGGCGLAALERTIELLDASGIGHVGAGPNLAGALAPHIVERNGVRIGILGFDDVAAEDIAAGEAAPGTAPLDDSYADERAALPREPAFYKPASMLSLERFSDRIRQLRARVDVVVVMVQSGYEDTHDPSPRSIKALRAAVEAGADIVLGNQAHWAGAVEMRGDSFATYAMGNFVFDQVHTPQHTQGFLVETILLDKRVANVRLLPYRILDLYRPEFADGDLRANILADVFDASSRLAEGNP
ncbi:MAG: CapA family protein [Dehalococcoidia bacterium]